MGLILCEVTVQLKLLLGGWPAPTVAMFSEKEDLISVLKFFQTTLKKATLPNTLYEAIITLIQNLANITITKLQTDISHEYKCKNAEYWQIEFNNNLER